MIVILRGNLANDGRIGHEHIVFMVIFALAYLALKSLFICH